MAVALRGVFAILFGLIALLAPGLAILSLVLLFAAYMLVDGIVGIVGPVRGETGRALGPPPEGLADIATGSSRFYGQGSP